MAEVSLRGIRKSYGAVPVFDGFALDIRDGELLSLLGPSGSGNFEAVPGVRPTSRAIAREASPAAASNTMRARSCIRASVLREPASASSACRSAPPQAG
ncbi:MAG: hypothetical protein ACREFZ_01540 [Acetobacteraceae bacterium]